MLDRVKHYRKVREGVYLATCPAHEDQRPSLSINENSKTGAVLVKCWAGCTFEEIIRAAGIEAHELFPPRPAADLVKGERRPFPALDVLKAVADETFYVAYIAATMAQGYVLTAIDKKLLEQSFDRIMEARRLCLGR